MRQWKSGSRNGSSTRFSFALNFVVAANLVLRIVFWLRWSEPAAYYFGFVQFMWGSERDGAL